MTTKIVKYNDPYGEIVDIEFDIGDFVDVEGLGPNNGIDHVIIVDTWDYDGDFDDELMRGVFIEAGAWICIVYKDPTIEPEIDRVYISEMYEKGALYG
jgi:hypothetical protein